MGKLQAAVRVIAGLKWEVAGLGSAGGGIQANPLEPSASGGGMETGSC